MRNFGDVGVELAQERLMHGLINFVQDLWKLSFRVFLSVNL